MFNPLHVYFLHSKKSVQDALLSDLIIGGWAIRGCSTDMANDQSVLQQTPSSKGGIRPHYRLS